MKMTDLLEKDKERLLTELTAAQVPEKAVRVLENESDKLLLRHNEQCSSERERETAAYMMQAVRLSVPLIDTNGRTRVWESGNDPDQPRKGGIAFIFLLICGLILLVYGLFPLVMAGLADKAATYKMLPMVASILGGTLLLALAGGQYSKPSNKRGRKEHHVEIHVDAEKTFRTFRTIILSVDQSLEELRAQERWNKREEAGTIDGRPATTPELDLFSDLIAASYSRDPEYALEKLDDLKYYLHKQQIEVVDYSPETAKYFDLMPGTAAGTIRPALIANGGLLKKGLASTGK